MTYNRDDVQPRSETILLYAPLKLSCLSFKGLSEDGDAAISSGVSFIVAINLQRLEKDAKTT